VCVADRRTAGRRRLVRTTHGSQLWHVRRGNEAEAVAAECRDAVIRGTTGGRSHMSTSDSRRQRAVDGIGLRADGGTAFIAPHSRPSRWPERDPAELSRGQPITAAETEGTAAACRCGTAAVRRPVSRNELKVKAVLGDAGTHWTPEDVRSDICRLGLRPALCAQSCALVVRTDRGMPQQIPPPR